MSYYIICTLPILLLILKMVHCGLRHCINALWVKTLRKSIFGGYATAREGQGAFLLLPLKKILGILPPAL